jgi:hypothetical protein
MASASAPAAATGRPEVASRLPPKLCHEGAEAGMDREVTQRRVRICRWLGWRRPGRGDPPPAVAR